MYLVVGHETDHLSSNVSKCKTVLRKLGYSIQHCNVNVKSFIDEVQCRLLGILDTICCSFQMV
jgi:hypothetical protein